MRFHYTCNLYCRILKHAIYKMQFQCICDLLSEISLHMRFVNCDYLSVNDACALLSSHGRMTGSPSGGPCTSWAPWHFRRWRSRGSTTTRWRGEFRRRKSTSSLVRHRGRSPWSPWFVSRADRGLPLPCVVITLNITLDIGWKLFYYVAGMDHHIFWLVDPWLTEKRVDRKKRRLTESAWFYKRGTFCMD